MFLYSAWETVIVSVVLVVAIVSFFMPQWYHIVKEKRYFCLIFTSL